jgi:uncharacterized protein (DUF983 family)
MPTPDAKQPCPRCAGAGAAVRAEASLGRLVLSYACQRCGLRWDFERADSNPLSFLVLVDPRVP